MEEKVKELYADLIGKQVVVRSVEAGVYFGTLTHIEGTTVRMENVRNIWSWHGAACLSQVAVDGITGGTVSQTVTSMVINGVCQVLRLSEKASANLSSQPVWKV